jgi:hypothetical protein
MLCDVRAAERSRLRRGSSGSSGLFGLSQWNTLSGGIGMSRWKLLHSELHGAFDAGVRQHAE